MNDDPIVEYLRARGRAEPPQDFVGSVLDAIADAPQERAPWFASLLPTEALLGAAAAVTVAYLLLNQNPNLSKPDPTHSASPSPVASQHSVPTLLEPGDSITVDAVDATGVWGAITIKRLVVDQIGEPRPGDARSIQLEIVYDAERTPSPAEFGKEDWTVALTSDGSTVARGAHIFFVGGPTLETYPRAYPATRDIFTEPIEGRVAMPLPAEVAEADLDLVYRPAGFATPVRTIPLQRSDEQPPTDADLFVAGNRFVGPALGGDQTWGTISLLRGEDVGGYRAVSVLDLDLENPDPAIMYFRNDPDAFYMEVFIRYEPDSAFVPANYGRSDWSVLLPDGEALEPIGVGIGGPLELHDSTADVALVNPDLDIKGWLIFSVPRTAAESELSLVYTPVASGVPAWSVPVRTARQAPDHIPTVQPPVLATYRAQSAAPITVAENASAEALFIEPDACTNPEAGYTVAFPESWYTNTAIGDVPACSWFSPVFFEVQNLISVPDEVVIVVRRFEASGIGGLGQGIYGETFEIDAVPAGRAEQVGVGGGFLDMGSFHYGYTLNLSESTPAGDDLATFITAATTWLMDEDVAEYELNRAVLDRIMASLEFTE